MLSRSRSALSNPMPMRSLPHVSGGFLNRTGLLSRSISFIVEMRRINGFRGLANLAVRASNALSESAVMKIDSGLALAPALFPAHEFRGRIRGKKARPLDHWEIVAGQSERA